MLRKGKITDAHRSGDKLSHQPLGIIDSIGNETWV
jgi:hypothetical protein